MVKWLKRIRRWLMQIYLSGQREKLIQEFVEQEKAMKFLKNLIIVLLSLIGMVCLFHIKFEIGLWLAAALVLLLAWMLYLSEDKVNSGEACILMFGLMFYCLWVMMNVTANITYKTNKIGIVIMIMIGAFLTPIDIRAIVNKRPKEKLSNKTMFCQFCCFTAGLLAFYYGLGACILPGTEKVTEAYVSDMWKEKNMLQRGLDYNYYIEYVEIEGDEQRGESQVSASVYGKVTPILGHVYVIEGRNVFEDSVRSISLTKESSKVGIDDILLAVLVAGCFVGATYVHYKGSVTKK